jgi:hypothetical protein
MSTNKKVMSMAIRPELHDELAKIAHIKGVSRSAYVGDLIEQAIKVNPEEDLMVIGRPVDEGVLPVVLKVPLSIKKDPEKLKKWLEAQMQGMYKALLSSGCSSG